jgi:hypothetical protein
VKNAARAAVAAADTAAVVVMEVAAGADAVIAATGAEIADHVVTVTEE